ncbi:hypothetical protein A5320_02400 [Rheinheimera sp. SA_1]|uniref:WD40/YVTN/BNR-like repeat-containing protein n=1 Tax=Rheinheimera sp. SA_1 TaxID=1827365 RepID=UPI0007FE8A9B|nr:hypothetical protein [Rheinheimera sp. SA_1]OBP16280.1 hypothetical protein A5320_02400 [Rheinheimera sp. SA_1]
MDFRCWILLIGCALGLVACGDSISPQSQPEQPPPTPFVFSHQGMSGLVVERLYQQQDKILALTDDGLYQQQQDSWQLLGLKGYSLRDLAFIDDQHWLAAVSKQDEEGMQSHQLQETFNAGASWQEVRRPFGADGEHEGIYALQYDKTQKRLYGTGIGVLAFSDDFGISWQVLQGFWRGFGQPKSALGIAPDRSKIWWGGQGAIEDGVLFSYRLADGHEQMFQKLLPDPSVYYHVRFAGNRIFACGEGGIVTSDNQGDSWKNLLPDSNYRFFFDVMIDSSRNNRLYTAGWDKKYTEPQPLILQWSDDAGQSWQRLQYQGATDFYGGVRSMLLVQRQQQTYLYLGLFKGGVMQVRVQ